jgi:AraC-like DNA-binding protein
MSRDGLDPVITCNVDEAWTERLALHVQPHRALLTLFTAESVAAAAMTYPLAVIVVQVTDVALRRLEFDRICATLAKLAAHPRAAMIVGESALSPRGALQLGAAGVSELFDLSVQRAIAQVAQWVERQGTAALHHAVWAAAGLALRPEAETIIRRALRLAASPFSVSDLANACGCSERSLLRLSLDAGLGPPNRVIRLARLLTAGFLLDRPGVDAETVVERLGFRSSVSLDRYVARCTGRSLAQIAPGALLTTVGLRVKEPLDHTAKSAAS